MPDIGDRVSPRELITIDGNTITVPSPDTLVHLQFRRFAACPICNLHVREVARRHDEIIAAGVTEVVVFHSSAEEMRRYQADLPFSVVADPQRELYREFGVETSIRSVLDPRAWRAGIRGVRWTGVWDAVSARDNHLGQPADFLIAADGAVLARKYGTHADDQWTVEELLTLAAR